MGSWSTKLQRELVVLVTGFVPFGGDPYNPSGVTARALDGKLVTTVNDFGQVSARIVGEGAVPVVFHDPKNLKSKETGAGKVTNAIEQHRPDVVISLGMTSETLFRIEREAHNVVRSDFPDNFGRRYAPPGATPSADGVGYYHHGNSEIVLKSTLPIDDIEAAIRRAGANVGIGTDPGKYVCEDVMFAVLHEQANPPAGVRILRGGFIHVPRLVRQGGKLLNPPLGGDSAGDAVTQDLIDACILAAIEVTVRSIKPSEYASTGSEHRARTSASSAAHR
jgi:pyroglutamyl-peptidase